MNGTTNLKLQSLIRELKRNGNKAALWHRVADDLERSTRSRREVNLSRINRYLEDGEIGLVPGKVLATGSIEKACTIAAWSFSQGALKKITDAKGKAITISELLTQNPEGKKVRIIG